MVKKRASKAIANWDEKLAQAAEEAATVEKNTGGGNFLSIAGGQLSFQDNPVPDNKLPVIIVDAIFENIYYDAPYVAGEVQAPTCFALNQVEDDLTPHEAVFKAGQNQTSSTCDECEWNEWGSADTGRGKACSNTRRLALIPAGTFDRDGNLELYDDQEHFKATPLAFLKLPVTSVKGYAAYVKQLAATLKRPPFGVVSELAVVPDPKTQFKVVFQALEEVPNELMEIMFERHDATKSLIDFPYQLEVEDSKPATRKKPAAKKKATAKKRSARRY